MKQFADDVLVMYLGEIVEHATRDQLFSNPQHSYTKELLSSTPVADPTKRRRTKFVKQ